ncbi:endonuclease/exonuclease/phosphatase family protein [Haloferula helveola]|uniref:endonuclease/exonuclease/phosphatase family protein n=1 Tax=Haloferula helveola TaxID=490095 RepID=UPI0030D0DF13
MPLIRNDSWWIRVWDFPRLQLLIVGIILMAALIGKGAIADAGDWIIVGLLAAATIHLAARVFPYQSFAPNQVASGRHSTGVRLLISNVLMDNREADALLQLVREEKPDVLIALETDEFWARHLDRLADQLPHRVSVPQPDTYGLVLMSRLPLIDAEVKYLVRENIPSVHGQIEMETGERVRFHALHPKPPFPSEDETSTERDIELIVVAQQIRETGGPTLVFGDMNDVAWSHTTRLFRRISGLLDPRIGRGMFSTFHAGHWWARWPLDHVFVSREFRVRELRRLPSVGSDHFPMLADLAYEPERKETQEKPDADSRDFEERDERVTEQPDHPKPAN